MSASSTTAGRRGDGPRRATARPARRRSPIWRRSWRGRAPSGSWCRRRSSTRRSRRSCRASIRATSSSTAATPTTATTSAAPATLGVSGLHYVDVGTSGGVAGRERGYCLMIGGEAGIVEHLRPIFAALAPGVDAAPRTSGRSGDVGHCRAGLSPLRPARRRPFRQDGPQRHRVRNDGRVRRRASTSCATPTSASASAPPTPRRRRCATRSSTGSR